MAAVRQLDTLRLLLVIRPRRLDVRPVQDLLQLARGDGPLGIEQIQNRKIVGQDFPEEQHGLIFDVALQLRVLPFRKQLRIRLECLAQVANPQPLVHKAPGKVHGLLVAQHARHLALQNLRIVQLSRLSQG